MRSPYSIIIPIYNEIETLPLLIKYIENYSYEGHEIIIIDDGSNDGSDQFLIKYNSLIKIFRFEENQGKGFALKKGIEKSTNEKLIIFDGDLELHPNQIKKLMILDLDKNIKCAFANRFPKNHINSFWDIGNKVLTGLFNYINNTEIKDALCCAKSFFKNDIETEKLKSSKFDIDIELLSKLIKNNNSKIKNIDINYIRRSKKQGKKLRFRDSFRILFRLIKN